MTMEHIFKQNYHLFNATSRVIISVVCPDVSLIGLQFSFSVLNLNTIAIQSYIYIYIYIYIRTNQ